MATARDAPLWAGALRQQVYLGDDAFVERMQARGTAELIATPETPPPQRAREQPQPGPLSAWLASCSTREEALYRAYRLGSGLKVC